MTHAELHNELSKYLYIEDHDQYDVILASIMANLLKLADPVWLTLIGISSGGKSQILRPFAMSNPAVIHRVDDLTSNSLMSGIGGQDQTFLSKVGTHGVICMDDLTVLFSKNSEQRGEILSQFRMLYDGRYSKITGSRGGEMLWEGYMGMISGSTPSIYRFFGEVADMGERFVNYRMKPMDRDKALEFIVNNPMSSRDMDQAISGVLQEYMTGLMAVDYTDSPLLTLSDEVNSDLSAAAKWFCLLRTPVHINERNEQVDEFPEPELPLRVMKQLVTLAKALQCVYGRPLSPKDTNALLWVGYSLSNDKRKRYLRSMVALEYQGKKITTRNLSALTGLHQEIIKIGVSSLQALGIVELTDETEGSKHWRLVHPELTKLVVRLDPPPTITSELDF